MATTSTTKCDVVGCQSWTRERECWYILLFERVIPKYSDRIDLNDKGKKDICPHCMEKLFGVKGV